MNASITIINGIKDVTSNYKITNNTISTGVITQALLIVTAVNDSKTYDGNVSSVGKPIVGTLVLGDVVNINPIQVYDNATVGKTHRMIASGLTIKNGSNPNVTDNYLIKYENSLLPGIITGKPLTANVQTIIISKEYDGKTSAVVTPGSLFGVASGDEVFLGASAAYETSKVDLNKKITITYSLSGANAAIYAVPKDSIIKTGIITPKALTVSETNIKTYKVYDGTPSSTFFSQGSLNGVITGDKVNLNTSTVIYKDVNVGTNITITCTYILTGAEAGNYTAPASYIENNGEITGKPLAVMSLKITPSKVYDSNTSATFTVDSLSGVEVIDIGKVELTGMATYQDSGVGIEKKITVTYKISGKAISNYIAPSDYTITNGEITAKRLTILDPTVVLNKMFDGNTIAVITTLGKLLNVETIDSINIKVTALADYENMNVGNNKTITLIYTLSGIGNENYSAPLNFVFVGAQISDSVRLSPIITPTAGCEGSAIDLAYSVLSGTPTQYKLTFSTLALAEGIQNVIYTNLPSSFSNGTLSFAIPKGMPDGNYQASLQMKNVFGIESPVYTFQFSVNVSSDFIIPKFDDVVLCNNSSNRFIGYQWYKDGAIIDGATKQFYNDLNGLIGSYSLKVTTKDGQILFICPKVLDVPLLKKVIVYPNLLKMNHTCTVKITGMTDAELKGAELSIYSMQGILIYQLTKVQKQNSISLPSVDGMYVGHVTTSAGQEFPFKVIVSK